MPTYEYLCGACGYNYEQVQKITENSLTICPKCGSDSLRRVINASAFHLKGSGWYKTDYASSTNSSSTSSATSSSATNSTTETKKAETVTADSKVAANSSPTTSSTDSTSK
jgi:putative FmdB family regulatory protein